MLGIIGIGGGFIWMGVVVVMVIGMGMVVMVVVGRLMGMGTELMGTG